jgi:hypothetical protein
MKVIGINDIDIEEEMPHMYTKDLFNATTLIDVEVYNEVDQSVSLSVHRELCRALELDINGPTR